MQYYEQTFTSTFIFVPILYFRAADNFFPEKQGKMIWQENMTAPLRIFLDNAVFIKTLPLIIFVSIKTLRRSYWEVDMDVSIIVAKKLSFCPS